MFSRNYQKTFNVVKNFLISWKSNAAAQKKKFSIKYFFSKCDQIRSFLRIWSHLLKKYLMENFIFCESLDMVFYHLRDKT